MTRLTLRPLLVAAIAVLLAATTACGGGDDTIETSGAWARTSPMMASAGAVYMDVTSPQDDVVVSASVPSEIAGSVEIHETVMADGAMNEDAMNEDAMSEDAMSEDAMSEDAMSEGMHGMDGAMTMRPLENGLALPAGETVSLEPGGYHIMLIDLPQPLETGQTFDITLNLESGATVVVPIEVRDDAP